MRKASSNRSSFLPHKPKSNDVFRREKLSERDQLENPGKDIRIILKFVF
jgi:hypothetical protein